VTSFLKKRFLVEPTNSGLYCSLGGFYIDPHRSVDKAVITHGHTDHARPNMKSYLTSRVGSRIVKERVGKKSKVEDLPYGQKLKIKDVIVSFHPSGHILGSSQVRIEHKGYVSVVTGDYKISKDNSCDSFELVKCHEFISESTFAKPFYRWPNPKEVFSKINSWWLNNTQKDVTSVIFAYALGKSQRVLCGLDSSIGAIGVHASVEKFNNYYREAGRPIPNTIKASINNKHMLVGNGIIIAPPSVRRSNWLNQFAPLSLSFASGWMLDKGNVGRKKVDKGFVLSDHADWSEILRTINYSGASRIGLVHGSTKLLADWLKKNTQLEIYEFRMNNVKRKKCDKRQMSFFKEFI